MSLRITKSDYKSYTLILDNDFRNVHEFLVSIYDGFITFAEPTLDNMRKTYKPTRHKSGKLTFRIAHWEELPVGTFHASTASTEDLLIFEIE